MSDPASTPHDMPTAWTRRRLALGIGISTVCLWLAFRNVPSGFFESLRGGNYWWLLPYPFLTVALNFVRACVWRRFLGGRVSRADAFWAYSVGFLANNILPFRLGEAARIGALTLRARLPTVEVAAAAALERVVDVIMLLTMLLVVLQHVSRSARMWQAAVTASLMTAFVLGTIVIVVAGRKPIDRLVCRLVASLPRDWSPAVLARWRELMDVLAVIRQPWTAAAAVVSMAAVWGLTVVMQWTVLRIVQPSADLLEACVMTVLISLAGAIPAAPGGIGIHQWTGQQALLVPFPGKYDPAVALAAAVMSHAASYVCSSVLGAIGLWRLEIPFARFRASRRQVPPAVVFVQPVTDR